MKKMFDFVKNNKKIFIFLFVLFAILCFCHFNTFLANDDLPYSFFKRLNTRVTNLFQVLWDNLRYYKSTNGRFILHCIIMTLLIFGKIVWSVLNPLMIVGIIFVIYNLSVKKEDKNNNLLSLILSSILFLMMYSYKNLIYWVAGSVNYLWTCAFIFIYIYLYLKKDIFKHKKINYLILFILSTLHENTFVFFLIFIIGLNIIEYIKTKKISYLKELIPIVMGGAILLLSPGNLARNDSYGEWYMMNIFEKINLSLPIVSKSVFSLFNIKNLIPTIYIVIILLKLLFENYNLKIKSCLISLIILLCALAIFTNITYFYAAIAIILLITETYIHITNKEEKEIPIQYGFYAVAFSMIITPLYNSFRPNLLLHTYFIYVICKYIIQLLNNKKTFKKIVLILSLILFIILCCFEGNIYYTIGKYHRIRLNQIEEYNKNPNGVLYLKKIPDKYNNYHEDCNNVTKEFWTYKWFIWYYGINEGTVIEYK